MRRLTMNYQAGGIIKKESEDFNRKILAVVNDVCFVSFMFNEQDARGIESVDPNLIATHWELEHQGFKCVLNGELPCAA